MIVVSMVLFFFGAIFVGIDVVSDARAGAGIGHVWAETLILAMCVGGLCYGFWQWRLLKRRYSQLHAALCEANLDAQCWRDKHQRLIEGLAEAINVQFNVWSLTQAEREVALLLIKGLSHKEIAEIRQSTEKTVRTHAASVYQKSSLQGRYELAAFFLEDLLAPLEGQKEV